MSVGFKYRVMWIAYEYIGVYYVGEQFHILFLYNVHRLIFRQQLLYKFFPMLC